MSMTYQEFVNIPNGTRIFNHGADECVAVANYYHEEVIGGSFIGVSAAHQWWTRSWPEIDRLYTKSLFPQPGCIFIAQGGIYDRIYGHIGMVTGVNEDGSFNTIEQNAGSGAARWLWRYRRANDNSIYGFLIPINNPAQQPITPTQRQAGSLGALRRTAPTTLSDSIPEKLTPGEVGNFVGWIHGEFVNDGIAATDIWYKGISGNWFWAGGFTSQSTDSLEDLNPPSPPIADPTQRTVGVEGVNLRSEPSTESNILANLAANSIVNVTGFIRGQEISGNNIWFRVEGGYTWAGGYTSQSTSSLEDLGEVYNPGLPEPTDPTAPVGNLGSPGSVLATIDRWDEVAPDWGKKWDQPVPASVNLAIPETITQRTVRPDRGFYEGREGKPNHIVFHHGVQTSLDGLVGSLMGQRDNSASAVIGPNEIVYMVDSRDTPSTNGRWRSNQYSVTAELLNHGSLTGKPSPETHEAAAWWAASEALRWGMKVPLERLEVTFGHKEVSKTPTACPGEVDLVWITNRANEIIRAHESNEEPPAPNYSDLVQAISGLTKVINSLIDLLKSIFRVGQ